MLQRLLAVMEAQPSATFGAAALQQQYGDMFEALVADGLLRVATRAPEYAIAPDGRRRLVVYEGTKTVVLVDEDDPESEPISVPSSDVVEWRVDLENVVKALRLSNAILDESGKLTERLWLVGTLNDKVVILALLASDGSARTQLGPIRDLVPGSPQHLLIACPTFRPSLEMRKHLEGRSITFATVDDALRLQEIVELRLPSESYDRWRSTLTPSQAAVVRYLEQAHRLGEDSVRWARLKPIATVGGANPTRMHDVFRHSPKWHEFIENTNRYYWRLKPSLFSNVHQTST